mgnify:CR=1 FL=1
MIPFPSRFRAAPRVRVLHVYRTYLPDTQGGLEEVIRQICAGSKQFGVESRILTLSRSPEPATIDRPEAKVHRTRTTFELASCDVSIAAFSAFRELADWADIVNYHFPWPFADVLHLTARHRPRSVVTYHSDIVRQRYLGTLYRPLMKRFLGSVDRIICTSPNYFATSPVLSAYADKVEVIPIGLDEQTYPKAVPADVAEWQRRFGRFFLFVGVLRYYKGLHILLDAVKDAPYRVVIAGSGPTEQSLKSQAARLGLSNVHFAGRVSDEEKVALFEASLGVVFPSYLRSEAFGVTLLEGAMHSRPLISTEVGSGTSHVNIDQETGLVVAPGSAKHLREAMDQLWHRPDVARHMGNKARKRYEMLFTGNLMGLRYAELYRRVLEGAAEDAGTTTRAAG